MILIFSNKFGRVCVSRRLILLSSPITCVTDNPAPGQPKEITITLLKARPATSREQWWRAPLKGLENRGPAQRPSQPADPELVRRRPGMELTTISRFLGL